MIKAKPIKTIQAKTKIVSSEEFAKAIGAEPVGSSVPGKRAFVLEAMKKSLHRDAACHKSITNSCIFRPTTDIEWVDKILDNTKMWVAELECGHKIGPYVMSTQGIPLQVYCLQCAKKERRRLPKG